MPEASGALRKIVWITGASTGIGRALAQRMAQDGWLVIASARSRDQLETLSADSAKLSGAIIAEPLDTTQQDDAASLVERVEAEHGPIDLAILNAGVFGPVRHAPFEMDAYRKMFDVNLYGTLYCLGPLIDRMVPRKSGSIYLVASVAGYSGLPSSAAYGATKAAMINMAESLKFDLDNHGVSIGVINPGFVRTPATDTNEFPMPHLMEVEDVADRIVDGLKKGGFEITFPRRFTYQLKLLRLLPHWLYFPLLARSTGWKDRKD